VTKKSRCGHGDGEKKRKEKKQNKKKEKKTGNKKMETCKMSRRFVSQRSLRRCFGRKKIANWHLF